MNLNILITKSAVFRRIVLLICIVITPSLFAQDSDVRVDDGSQSWKEYPDIALDKDGNIYAVWHDDRDGTWNWAVYFAKSTDGGKTFGADIRVGSSGIYMWTSVPSVRVSDDGTIYVIWSDEGVYIESACALGEIKATQSVDPLIDALNRGNAFAAMALGKIKDQRAVEPLIDALESDDGSLASLYYVLGWGERYHFDSSSNDSIRPNMVENLSYQVQTDSLNFTWDLPQVAVGGDSACFYRIIIDFQLAMTVKSARWQKCGSVQG